MTMVIIAIIIANIVAIKGITSTISIKPRTADCQNDDNNNYHVIYIHNYL